jgi:hypothetical protein
MTRVGEGVDRNDFYYDCCGTVIRNLLAQQRRKHVAREQLSFQLQTPLARKVACMRRAPDCDSRPAIAYRRELVRSGAGKVLRP